MPATTARLLTAAACLAAIVSLGCDELMPKRSEGEKLYRKRCTTCHGVDGAGNTPRYMSNPGADLLDNAWKHGNTDGAIGEVIRYGVLAEMPDNEDLTQEQIDAIVAHIRDLRGEVSDR